MRLKDLTGKKICILGFGREGKAMLDALEKNAVHCEVTIADRDERIHLPPGKHWQQIGTGWLRNLTSFDVLIKSPGIPPQPEFKLVEKKMTSGTQIFWDSIKGSGATVIGVTGSKGKSTTSSLIHEILKNAGKDAYLIGNIGEPAIKHLKDARKNTIFVQELSSYQLMNLTSSPQIAVITSFFPEHLDYHGSLGAYLEAKKHITRFQKKNDVVFFANKSKETKEIASESKGEKIAFDPKDSPVKLKQIKLQGEHNLGNIAAAYKVAMRLGVDPKDAIATIKRFEGLPHRLQSLGIHGGIEWVNDSISTTPQSAVAALDALGDRVKTIIVGGQDRGYDFSPLAKRLKTSSVKVAILLPDSGKTIGQHIKKTGAKITLAHADTMEAAVKGAKKCTSKGSIVLLSPASPSYGHFKNFEDRGERFERAIKN